MKVRCIFIPRGMSVSYYTGGYNLTKLKLKESATEYTIDFNNRTHRAQFAKDAEEWLRRGANYKVITESCATVTLDPR